MINLFKQLMELMKPENWSAAAVHEATCILVSNLKGNDAARLCSTEEQSFHDK